MKSISAFVFTLTLLGLACLHSPPNQTVALPENIESTPEGKLLEDSLKAIYRAQLYYAAPGTNVDSIRYENWKRNYAYKQALRAGASARSTTETFANGLLVGTWHERGPNNEAGDIRAIDFDPVTEDLYAISTVGHLWKGNLNGATWTKLNDDIRFEREVIQQIPHLGGKRIFAVYGSGVDNKKIRFSDNEGQTWTTGTGFTFYDHWGRGRRLHVLSDNNTLYYLVHTWQSSPWGQVYQLYKSTNKGLSYTKIWNSAVGYEDEEVDLWKPYDSDEMYLVDNRSQNTYRVTHNFTTGAATLSAPVSYSSNGIALGGVHLTGRYNTGTGAYDLFLAHDDNQNVYQSTFGSAWTFLSTCPENVWQKGWLADPDNSNLYVGGFQINKTSNGVNWTEQYPQWWRYYSHSKDSLHVDVMSLDYFQKANGTPFILILDHAGVHITYDHFQTTANLGLQNLNVVTLYDQTTASDGFLYCGAQDKGTFKYGSNSLANFNTLATTNMSTGDGMLGVFINSDQSFFGMLQNGGLLCFKNRNSASYSSFDIPGTHKPGWINPMVPTPNFADNKAYVAGGNLSGGSGSYLIVANVNLASGVSWQNTQYNYDFRANSNNGTSVIKAIGVSVSDQNRIYVATQDASFFSTSNQGSTWTKSSTANLPATLLPWDIKCSKTNPDRVFICGTGFSNAGVYESTNGGSTFTALSTGLPASTVFEVALDNNEQFLFAATSEGPYVYVFDDAQWYSLMGADTPILDFNTVDIVANNVVRFGTYGRGVWDFEVTNSALPVELAAFSAQPQTGLTSRLDWTTALEVNVKEFSVEHSLNGVDFQSVGVVPARGAGTYQFTHRNARPGNNYYRLVTRDLNGALSYSQIEVVKFGDTEPPFAVFPNLVAPNGVVNFQPSRSESYTLHIYNSAGQLVAQHTSNEALALNADFPRGVYVYQIATAGQARTSGKLVVR